MPTLTKQSRSRIPTADLGNGKPKPEVPLPVRIPKLTFQEMIVCVEGKSPLIVHAWSSKAIRMMLGKQLGEASPGREKKDPLEDFKQSLYYLPNNEGLGVPSPAFKACIVSGANEVEMKMTEVKRCVHVVDYYTKIEAPPLDRAIWTEWDVKYEKELEQYHKWGCSMRQDLVRLSTGVADIRFRGSFPIWSAKIRVEFNNRALTADQVVNLFQSGGLGCGIGEWRPSAPECRSGEFGRFKVQGV